MASEPLKFKQIKNTEKEEADSEETKIGCANLLVWTLQEASTILRSLYESNYDLKPLTDHLGILKLLIMDV